MGDIIINVFELGKHDLNINEYFTLMRLEHDTRKAFLNFEPDQRYYQTLIDRGFIILTLTGPEITAKGLAIFSPDKEDLFEEFYNLFPHKVETAYGIRPVSTASVETLSAKNTRNIWNRVTKGKVIFQRRIINALEKELTQRRAEGSLGYLQGIDTWLRQSTWEKWENISNDSKRSSGNYIQL